MEQYLSDRDLTLHEKSKATRISKIASTAEVNEAENDVKGDEDDDEEDDYEDVDEEDAVYAKVNHNKKKDTAADAVAAAKDSAKTKAGAEQQDAVKTKGTKAVADAEVNHNKIKDTAADTVAAAKVNVKTKAGANAKDNDAGYKGGEHNAKTKAVAVAVAKGAKTKVVAKIKLVAGEKVAKKPLNDGDEGTPLKRKRNDEDEHKGEVNETEEDYDDGTPRVKRAGCSPYSFMYYETPSNLNIEWIKCRDGIMNNLQLLMQYPDNIAVNAIVTCMRLDIVSFVRRGYGGCYIKRDNSYVGPEGDVWIPIWSKLFNSKKPKQPEYFQKQDIAQLDGNGEIIFIPKDQGITDDELLYFKDVW